MYSNTTTLTQHSESEIRVLNPSTSFPSPFVPPSGYAYIFPAPAPAFDPVTQRAEAAAPELTALGHYEQRWAVVARFTEYTDDQGILHTVAEQESMAIADAQASQAQALQASAISAVQARLDVFAKTRNYDSILSAATYATSSVPKFAAEGQYAVDARDQTWSALYALLGEVLAGTRVMPASFADVEPLLPVLVWPE